VSIYAYTGLPGSGKSYSVVEHQIIPALKSGRRVATNVALRFDKLREAFPGAELVELPTAKVQADPATIYEYVQPGTVLVLDEVWRLFPAGLKANHVPEPFRKLLAEHRHMVDEKGDSCQIVLVTQDLAQISAFARQLVETTFRTVKLTTVGLTKQYRVDVYNGPATGPNPPESARIRQIFGTFQKSVWQFYESHTMKTEGAGKVEERSVDRRANILARPVMVIGAVAACLFVIFGYRGITNILADKKAEAVPAVADATAASPPAREPRVSLTAASLIPGAPGQTGDTLSEAAKLVGVLQNIDNPDASIALVQLAGRVVSRPLRYCTDRQGWWVCRFPDLGELSL